MTKSILLIHTGGTIAMSEDKSTGEVKPTDENPLQSMLTEIDGATFTDKAMFNIPSPHMTPEIMLQLSKEIKKELQHHDGVVITHGTDTLEETAYLLDLLHETDHPIVVTGAMRSSNELGSDGPYNFIAAIRTALSEQARGLGVLVVLNDEIHSAKNVTKTHASNIATFQSPQYGPIGIVTKGRIIFHHQPVKREHYTAPKLTKNIVILKAYAGMDSSVLRCLRSIDGVIIEALGQGNLPPETVPGIEELINRGIPVVLVSRCYSGIVQDVYGYAGGGRKLKEAGVIFTNGLNGQKARIKLLVAMELTDDLNELQQLFDR